MTDSRWVSDDSGDVERWRQAAANARARIAAFPDVPADLEALSPVAEATSNTSTTPIPEPIVASAQRPSDKPASQRAKRPAADAATGAALQASSATPPAASRPRKRAAAKPPGAAARPAKRSTRAQAAAEPPALEPEVDEARSSIVAELAELAGEPIARPTRPAPERVVEARVEPGVEPGVEPEAELEVEPTAASAPVSVGAATAAAELATQVTVTPELVEPRGEVRSYPLTAADFSESAVLGRRGAVARFGWRHVLGALSNGRLRLPPSPYEVRRNQLLGRVRTPIDGTRRIVVMSRKGGVGKTTVTVGVGATFAALRGDRVVAVDANPDAGNLAHRIAGDCQRTITDLLADSGRVRSFAMMRGYTSQCSESRLEVLASDDDARIAQALDRDAYRQVVSLLDHFYNLILLDTGTGILDSANQGLLAEADQLVLVVRPALDGARAGAQTLDWLEEHGHGDLVSSAVVVINGVERESDPIVGYTRKHFASRCARVTTVPWDRALEAGGRTTLSSLHRRTRAAFLDVAAALADGFSEAPLARDSRAAVTHEFRFTPVDPILD